LSFQRYTNGIIQNLTIHKALGSVPSTPKKKKKEKKKRQILIVLAYSFFSLSLSLSLSPGIEPRASILLGKHSNT
jgi:hypothetical protein